MRDPAVPYLETAVGGIWWTVGASALGGGPGTVVLAAGLGVIAALVVAQRRRFGAGAPLPPGGRGRLLRLVGTAVVLVVASVALLGVVGWGELGAPVACAVVGAALMPAASVVGNRALVAVGAALMVLGAVGALLALDSAGRLYPQGVVGLVAGALLWAAAAYRSGLIDEARGRVRR